MDSSDLETLSEAPNFKQVIDQHKVEGWSKLPAYQKAFICTYIRDGYSIAPMVQRGCPEEEAVGYLNDPIVRAAITDVSDQYVAINTFSAVGWRTRLARALEMSLGEIPRPIASKDGKVKLVRSADLATAARLLELAAKYKDLKDSPKEKEEFERFTALPWEARA